MDVESKNPSPAITLRNQIREANPQREGDLIGRQSQVGDLQITTERDQAVQSSESFLGKLPLRKALEIRRALKILSSSDQKRYFSLVDIVNAQERQIGKSGSNLHEASQLFDSYLGSIVLPKGVTLEGSPLSDFFTQNRIWRDRDVVQLRGDNYFIALNKHKKTIEKLDIIRDDFIDGLEVLSGVRPQEINTQQEYLLYLGILDYLKVHSLTLFHALTYPERFGIFSEQGTNSGTQYQAYREKALKFASLFTRQFYQTLFGVECDQAISDIDVGEIADLINYVRLETISDAHSTKLGRLSYARMKYPEINHPIIIALGAQKSVRTYPDTEVVFGIPTGGTETAIVTQLVYELLRKKNPDLVLYPLSLNSEIKIEPTQDEVTQIIGKYFKLLIEGKNILVVDDNSASGRTLKKVSTALFHNFASGVAVHLAEFDGRQLVIPSRLSSRQSFFNPDLSPTTIGLHQVGPGGKHTYKTIIDSKLNERMS